MINYNGSISSINEIKIPINNRAFSYGDALFETLKFNNSFIAFLEDHYFRLMASMRMLRMEIPMFFTLDFFESEIKKTIQANKLETARIRFQVFRKTGGLYTPTNNNINFLIEVTKLNYIPKETFELDLFKDYYISTDILSNLKTTSRNINVLGSIYAQENELDDAILINQNKHIVETTKANIFLVKENRIYTPALSDGCIKGIMRKKVIEKIKDLGMFYFEEISISPFELQKADAVFITNSIIGIQNVSKYRKKKYNLWIVENLKKELDLV